MEYEKEEVSDAGVNDDEVEEDDDAEPDDDNELVVKNLDKYAKNIADQMSEDQLKILGKLVADDVKADLESRDADMTDRWDRWAKLYVGRPEQSKLSERAGAPNIHTPGSSVAIDQFSSRAEKYLLPPNNIAKADGTGAEDRNRAWRVAKAMNIIVEKQIPKFRRTFGTAVKQSAIFGMAALKTWWNDDGGHPHMAVVPAEDFIVSYTHSGPLENAERITHRLRMTKDKIRKKVKAGVYHEDCWDLEKDQEKEEQGLSATRKEVDGWTPSKNASDDGDIEVYEQHRCLDLDGDGIGEKYIVTVHAETETVMRVVSRCVQGPNGEEEDVDFFTEIPFDYNPLGFYSLGIGAKTEGLNILQNSIANLLLFSGIRNSFPPKFCSKKAFKSPGEKEYELDEWIEAEMHVDDLAKALFIAPTVAPSPVLMNLYQEAGQKVREVVSVTDVMQGAAQPHNQAATTTKIIQQESMELFNGSFRRMLDALSELLTKLYKLCRLHLADEEYVEMLGQTGQPEQAAWEQAMSEWQQMTSAFVAQVQSGGPVDPRLHQAVMTTPAPPATWCSVVEDFADTVDLIPTADPNITTEQERLAQSEAAMMLVAQGPEPAPPRAIWAAKRNRLEALRVPASVIAELLPEPQEPPPPPNLRPNEALAALLRGQPVAIMPDQAHPDYVAAIDAFKEREEGSYWNRLDPATKEAVDRHAQERIAAILEAEGEQGGPQVSGDNAAQQEATGAGMPLMGGPPGGEMVPIGA